jgi:kojibiose phosphorylase
MSEIKALIFDLDGVLTDTAEYHYLAWKKLADEEGLPFSRADNEKLRGVSRQASLQLILGEQKVTEDKMQSMMQRKNDYYRQMLSQVSPDDLLPGVAALLDKLDAAGLPYALASASKNAPDVVARLGIAGRLAVTADGSCVTRPKPAPDLFRYAAARLNVPPDHCLVVEDAAAGIAAAVTAGMPALAIGPAERFEGLLDGHGRITRRDNLQNLTLAELRQMGVADETWTVVQDEFSAANQHHMETVFTIGNGYFASRGSLEEGYPGDHPLTLAHGIFDDMPVAFTELVNLPNWLDVELWVDERPFRLDQGQILHFHRTLNLYQGILRREVRWQSPDGVVVDLSFERFASYAREHVAGLRLLVTAVNQPCHITLHSGINGHVANDDLLHWRQMEQGESESGEVWWHGRTRHTDIELGVAARVETTVETAVICQQCPGQPRFTISQPLDSAQTIQIDKLVSYAATRDAVPEAADVVGRALQNVHAHHYDDLRLLQQNAWAQLWRDCDVIIEGDDEAQLAVRFNLFQLLIAAAQHDDRVSIGAKTLSGLGYRGHVFWDTEIFILPFFTFTKPELTRNMLLYRYHTLAGARQKAAVNGYEGAQYAWESAATGEEVTPTWVPHFSDRTQLVRIWTGDIQIHISADIAYAIMQYWRVTGDDAFLRDYGAEMILDTARFWGSRAEREETAVGHRYAFRNVIGPDEYHDHVDNNCYTNYVARGHLQTALELLDWLKSNQPAKARQLITDLQITDDVLAHWQDVIAHTIFLYDVETGLIDQFENFFGLEEVSPEFIAQADKSLQVIFGIEGANRRQVLKQGDVIMLLCLFRDQFDRKTWQTNWDTYMPKTDHVYGSSLGPSFHAWAACEMGRPEEAYAHFMLAARADLRNPRGNAGDGIHAGSAGGLWQALVFGFAGLRLTEDGRTLSPRLPDHWQRLAFNYRHRGERWRVDIQNQGGEGKEVKILHKRLDVDL